MVLHLFVLKKRISENTGTEQETIQRSTVIPRGGYPDDSDSDSHDNRRPHNGQRPLEEEGIKIGVEGHQIEEIIMIEVTLEEEGPLMEMEDPLMMEDP